MAIDGMDRLMRKLARLGADKQALKKGIHKAAIKVQGDAKALAPSDTGQLRNSIKAQVTEERGKIIGRSPRIWSIQLMWSSVPDNAVKLHQPRQSMMGI
ncbi:HK97 gp10 family phage protein [Paenibacillus amylolyticus]|nr:HK97 gp10 family phage protein [Paenibacillus amylolyticus]WFR64201.1 HK97 gp10 family phage protein [Paenibacillus amylolyticus]